MKKPQETVQPRATKTARAAKTTGTTKRSARQPKAAPASNPLDEIRELRREVAELKRRLAAQHTAPVQDNLQPWLKIAATVGVTLALGKIMQALRFPAAAAVAVPMISAEVNRRFF